LWENLKLRVLENTVLRYIRAPEREEVTGDWGRVYIEDPRGLYSSPLYDQIKEKERGGARRTNGEKRKACRSVVGKPEGKRPSKWQTQACIRQYTNGSQIGREGVE